MYIKAKPFFKGKNLFSLNNVGKITPPSIVIIIILEIQNEHQRPVGQEAEEFLFLSAPKVIVRCAIRCCCSLHARKQRALKASLK